MAVAAKRWTLEDWDPVEASQRGAKLLDEKIPGWADTVHESILNKRFDMRMWESCLVGTLELRKEQNSTLNGLEIWLNGTSIVGYDQEASGYGFVVPFDLFLGGVREDQWPLLTEAWKERVAERVNA